MLKNDLSQPILPDQKGAIKAGNNQQNQGRVDPAAFFEGGPASQVEPDQPLTSPSDIRLEPLDKLPQPIRSRRASISTSGLRAEDEPSFKPRRRSSLNFPSANRAAETKRTPDFRADPVQEINAINEILGGSVERRVPIYGPRPEDLATTRDSALIIREGGTAAYKYSLEWDRSAQRVTSLIIDESHKGDGPGSVKVFLLDIINVANKLSGGDGITKRTFLRAIIGEGHSQPFKALYLPGSIGQESIVNEELKPVIKYFKETHDPAGYSRGVPYWDVTLSEHPEAFKALTAEKTNGIAAKAMVEIANKYNAIGGSSVIHDLSSIRILGSNLLYLISTSDE